MKKTTTRSTRRTKTTYVAVSSNVYYDGGSYRVRATVDGVKHSKNFSNKKTAIQYRNSLLAN
jgi:hypothetical protein